ncbi:unnamed protein product [Triticum turgidum subsp. durum]|uniref:Uncharacterized protein n=1 Tax=Triticum turgidum subsp. durum TaxID=4567 RepID=A0A9R1A3G8_TRITD|nr:unnamed protein product [Triticum turgidum subsp. durum]
MELPLMDGFDLPTTSGPSATIAGGDDRPPKITRDGGLEDVDTGPLPDRCEALAAAIAGELGGALEEHEARAAATAQSQAELATAIDRLNGGRWLPPASSLTPWPQIYLLLAAVSAAVPWGCAGSSSPRVLFALRG